MKYGFDLVVSLVAMILLAPLFVIISILIRIEDNGPVFFKHPRVGQGGRMFTLYKFRSMKLVKSEEEGSFEPGDTSRVTSIGKYIRRMKLDELPQLINVIKGDMSLVGPRPEIKKWVSVFPEKWKIILTVKPGITDVASLEYHNEESILAEADDPETVYKEIILPKKLELCEKYVSKHSLRGDIKIIIHTLILILTGKQTYKQEYGKPA
jgi:lipopolysaccharide/colanic/teichoic acid biosynthesis glycosyltransferase